MAGIYRSAISKMMTGDIDLEGATATAYLVSSSYTANLSTHGVLADVASSTRQAQASISGRSVTNEQWTASPTTFNNATGADVNAVVVTVGNDLVAYVDDFGAGAGSTTLALNGSDVTINWSSSGILRFT